VRRVLSIVFWAAAAYFAMWALGGAALGFVGGPTLFKWVDASFEIVGCVGCVIAGRTVWPSRTRVS
jgi:hypothetical protein